jgi:hypothetical protein
MEKISRKNIKHYFKKQQQQTTTTKNKTFDKKTIQYRHYS